MEVKKELAPFVRRNNNKSTAAEAYNAFAVQERSNTVNLKAGLFALMTMIISRYPVQSQGCNEG